jgi:hypothetical protein
VKEFTPKELEDLFQAVKAMEQKIMDNDPNLD